MIIFDLDGTLANCEHRRHFVDPNKNLIFRKDDNNVDLRDGWQPDWKSFYEACDKDEPILPTITMLRYIKFRDNHSENNEPLCNHEIQIWSGRCESVRNKTKKWLSDHKIDYHKLKMRPIGDNTPDDQLKERWLDEAISEDKQIEMVFDDRPKVIRMWRRKSIFVFNVNQTGNEF